jgi:tetratricopeptide (TPR) repeat protein
VKSFRFKIIILLFILFATPGFAQYNLDILFSNAKADIDKHNYIEAITKLNKCLSVQPDNCEAYFYRAICKYSLFDNFGADEDFTMALSKYSYILYDAYHYRSLTLYRLGRFYEALDDINKVIEKDPDSPGLYVERAFIYLANSNFKEAIIDCKKAISLKSLGEDGYICKAQAEFSLSDYQDAVDDYDAVIKINPKNIDAIALRGMTKYKMDLIQEAVDDYNLAIKTDSTSTLAYYNRADVEIKLNDTTEALSDFNMVLKYEPRNSYAYFDRGALYANMKEYALAISDFNKVIILNPNNIEALFNRGKLKQVLGDIKGAISDYDKVTILYPYFMEAYYYRSQAKYMLKDIEGANKDIEIGKLMSDIFHNNDNMEFNKDSLLLNKLTHLSADFHTESDIKPDNANNNFLPIFYITEKDSNNYKAKNFSLLLEDFNFKNAQTLCLKNKNSYNKDSSLSHSISIMNDSTSKQALLVTAIYRSNMKLFAAAKIIFDKIISEDSLNAIAIFARGINTCREIESQNSTNNNYYFITNPQQEKQEKERKEKCMSALADFSKTLRLNPNFYFALYNRAYVKCLLSDFYGANFDYDQAIKKNPAFADAYFNNAYLLYYLNLKQAACENFSKAGELGISEAFSIIKKNCNGN